MRVLLKRFGASRRANVAISFALASVPCLFAAGAAIDYARSADLRTRLQAGTDAATLAACKSTTSNTAAAVKTDVQTTLPTYVPNGSPTVDTPTVTASPRSVTVTTHATYTTAFMKLAGYPTVAVAATSSCSAGDTYYEIALVLDTTGSMANSAGGVSKLQSMQSAATDFVNYMFNTIPTGHLKIALVPFASTVKVDPTTYAAATWIDQGARSSLHWQNVTNVSGASSIRNRFSIFTNLSVRSSSWSWQGCLESLPYPLNVSDGAPTTSNYDSYYLPYFYPDEVGTTINGNQDYLSNNSYIDDGTSTGSSSCDSNNSNQTTRLGQACKYVVTKNARTSQGGPNYLCSPRPLTRLTTSQSTLLNEISQFSAAGSTNIHEGIMWGWRTISPNSVFADGTSYTSTTNTVKVIVLMTDGTNQWLSDSNNPVNKSYYSAYGYFYNADGTRPNARLMPADANPTTDDDGRTAIDNLTKTACANIQATGKITTYTIGFSVPSDPIDATGQALLSACAGASSRYYLASDSGALQSAFSSIAQGIGQLRLTK